MGGKKNLSLSMTIAEKPAGPHSGCLCRGQVRQTQNSDCIDLSNKKFKNKKKNFFCCCCRSRNDLGN